MSSFGWYRDCYDCKYYISDGIFSAADNTCKLHPMCDKNRDHNCKSFKRVWWKFWVPGDET